MSLIKEILTNKREELVRLRNQRWHSDFAPRALPEPSSELGLIAEIKFRSPSAGQLNTTLNVEQRAQAYADAGAAMVSVLCDEKYFGGSYQDLARARGACELPLLCKEFVVDECQLDAALAHGADAVLLIARCLSEDELSELITACKDRELTPLVEVYTQQEAELAVHLEASWIGVNVRNLNTLEMDLPAAQAILRQLPASAMKLHLSGIKTPEDIAQAKHSGANMALVGEVLMRQADPEPTLRALVEAGTT